MTWKQIEELTKEERETVDEEFEGFQNLWEKQKATVQERDQFKEFNRRLNREFAIETGLIEGLYTLERGITQTLIEQGLNAAIIPHNATDGMEAQKVIAIIRDQESSLQSLRDFVLSERPLSTSYIKELHAQLTQNQDSTEAQDQFGKIVEVKLLKGEWKTHSNNPTRANGEEHIYCPPLFVNEEMERLCELANRYKMEKVPIQAQSAWLHHRFTQIHPFQDGNGRVARALATLILLRSYLFPFTIKLEQRNEYISALELADNGDLSSLTAIVTKQQISALRKAISVAEQVNNSASTADALIVAAKDRLVARFAKKADEFNEVYTKEKFVSGEINRRLEEAKTSIDANFAELDIIETVVALSHEDNAYYFTRDVAIAAKQHGYFADFKLFHSWVFLRIEETVLKKKVSEFSIFFSIHPVGKSFEGTLTVSAFRTRKHFEDEEGTIRDIEIITEAPFNFFYNQDEQMILSGLTKWVDQAIVNGLADWQRGL